MGFWLIGAEVILVMTAFGACCGGLIHTWCASQRRSRCSSFSCCCGLISCIRQVESDALMEAELEAENKAKVSAQPPPAPAPNRERSSSVDSVPPPASVRV